jgi:hypothetical protein
MYYLDIMFFTGFELNDYSNKSNFDDNSIIGIVNWDNGGHSVIVIDEWVTDQKILDEKELKFTSNGRKISKMKGYDSEGRYWDIEFL